MKYLNIDAPKLEKYFELVKESCFIFVISFLALAAPDIGKWMPGTEFHGETVLSVAIFCFVAGPAALALAEEICEKTIDRL